MMIRALLVAAALGAAAVGTAPVSAAFPPSSGDWMDSVCRSEVSPVVHHLPHADREGFCNPKIGEGPIYIGLYTQVDQVNVDMALLRGGFSWRKDNDGDVWVFVVFSAESYGNPRDILKPLEQYGFAYVPMCSRAWRVCT
jgi:hypothetical protein